MELLFLLLLPFLGALVGDGTTDDDSAEDEDSITDQATPQSVASPGQQLAEGDEPATEGKSTEDTPETLPGGDWSEIPARMGPEPEPVLVADFNGAEEHLILEFDSAALPDVAQAKLEASTDATTGDVILSLAGQKLAILAAPDAFDLAQVALRAV